MNLYEQQSANRRRTWLIMIAFIGFLLFLGIGFDAFFVGEAGGAVPIGSIAALGVGSVSALVSYYSGDRAVLAATSARPIDELKAAATDADRLKLQQLDNVVDEMAIAAGLPRPAVYVVPDPDPNAFATGRGPGHASIAVTRGLARHARPRGAAGRRGARDEPHQKPRRPRDDDRRRARRRRRAAGGLGAARHDVGRRLPPAQRRRRERSGVAGILFFGIWIVAVLLAPFLSQLLAMMVSRRREYLADASGAELTRNPMGLARALEKIDSAVGPDTPSIKDRRTCASPIRSTAR